MKFNTFVGLDIYVISTKGNVFPMRQTDISLQNMFLAS